VREIGLGLATVDGNELHLLPGGERFAEEKVYGILPYGDGRLLLVARAGATLLDPTGKKPPEKLVTEADSFFADRQVYAGCALPGGIFVLASLRGGIAVIDRNGRLLERIDKKRGLNDETVYFPFVGHDGRLWLGLSNGISIVRYPAAVTRIPNEGEVGLEGFVESVTRYRGDLIASTSLGLYRMTPAATAEDEPRFTAIGGIANQCYSVLAEGDTLLAATRDGIFAIDGDKATKIDPAFAYTLVPSQDPNRVIAGYDDGVGILERQGSLWKVTARLEDAGHEVVGVLDGGPGEIWGGTDSNGLYRIAPQTTGPAPKLTVTEHFDEKAGLPEGWVHPFRIAGEVRFGTREGIYRFDRHERRFRLDPPFERSLGRRAAFRLQQSADGQTLWIVSENEVLRFVRAGDEWRQVPSSVKRIGAGDRVLSFFAEGDVLWIGGDVGLFRYVVPADSSPPKPRALVREAQFGAKNTIKVAFSGAGDPSLELSTFLQGFDSGWSAWSRDSWKEYTNLPGGRYVFRVRARDAYGQVGPAAELSFTLRKPWFLRWWALALFAAAAVLLIYLIVRIRGAQLRRRNLELERIIDAKTAALREASYTDPLTSLRNRRFFSEVIVTETALQPSSRLVLLLADLDFFKSVNDRFGHAAGDAVLTEAAGRLRSVARSSDLLVRWGGEEFLLIAREAVAGDAAELARRILAVFITSPFRVGDEEILLSVSVGWTQYPLSMTNVAGGASGPVAIEAALDLADRGLYQAKASGRNRAVGYVPAADGTGQWLVVPGQ
jgi:diguanylate cyclase (GGDEF)-like protein